MAAAGEVTELKEATKETSTTTNFDLRRDEAFTAVGILAIQIFVVIVAGTVDFEFTTHLEAMEYGMFRDVSLMIFFGFGFLMTFLHKYGLSAIGYCLVISAVAAELSIVIEYYMMERTNEVSIETLLNGLFCAGAVMITYGAVLGKVTPFQLLVIAVIEVVAFWANFRLAVSENVAHDVGGGLVIHTFGAYFGLAAAYWVTTPAAIHHVDEKAVYSSDIFSMAGTILLWVLWPSFQAAVAPGEAAQMKAAANTFLSLCSSSLAFAVVSRLVNGHRFNVVHMQNATLAGGVVMGVAGDLDMGLHVAMIMGFVAGTLSCLGYAVIHPLLIKIGVHDTCGVNNLHGMPGLVGAILSIILIGAKPEGWAGADVTAVKQFYATLITLGVALASGTVAGMLVSWPLRKLGIFVPSEHLYSDELFFESAEVVDKNADVRV